MRILPIPRLWKYTTGLVFCLSLLMTGLVQGVKLLDLPGCMVVYTTAPFRSYEFDLLSERYFADSHIAIGQFFPDSNHIVTTEVDRGGKFRLTVSSLQQPEPVVLEEVIASNWNSGKHLRWSQDDAHMAYLWQGIDRVPYLSVANDDGSRKRSVPLVTPDGKPPDLANTSLVGWSADGSYLTIAIESFDPHQMTYSFWSLNDLRPLPQALTVDTPIQAVWSPDGHQFAALVAQSRQPLKLILLSPDAASQKFALPERIFPYLSWSPDGRYLLVAARLPEKARPYRVVTKWIYDVYSRQGETLHSDVSGASIASEASRSFLTGLWSGDQWLFLRERGDGNSPKVDLVALDIPTGLSAISS